LGKKPNTEEKLIMKLLVLLIVSFVFSSIAFGAKTDRELQLERELKVAKSNILVLKADVTASRMQVSQLRERVSGVVGAPKPAKQRSTPGIVALPKEFFLQDVATKKLFGPYDSAKGATVRLKGRTFSLFYKEQSPLEQQLARIIIPEVDFRHAYIYDVFSFLEEQSREHSADHSEFKFILADEPLGDIQDGFFDAVEKEDKDDFFSSFGKNDKGEPIDAWLDQKRHVNFRMRNASVLEILRVLSDTKGFTYKFSNNTVLVFWPEPPNLDKDKQLSEKKAEKGNQEN
jgi:hypothetical protein